MPAPTAGSIPEEAISFLHLCEGCRLEPYLDSEGFPTQGWGQRYPPGGGRVSLSDAPITQQEADEWFNAVLVRDFWVPLQSVPHWQEMGDGLRSALLSFAYNTGYVYGHKDFHTLNNALKNKNWNNLGETLILYRNPGSASELGLARRRYAESLLAKGISADNAYAKAFGMDLPSILKTIA